MPHPGPELSNSCPCCGAQMPATDFILYPKSAAILYDGYVLQPGMIQFNIAALLWKAYPDYVSIERIHSAIYGSTNSYHTDSRAISVHVFNLRKKLYKIGCTIEARHSLGYRLRFTHQNLQRRQNAQKGVKSDGRQAEAPEGPSRTPNR